MQRTKDGDRTRPPAQPEPQTLRDTAVMNAQGRTVRLIGAPTDVGASLRGASLGPQALRRAGLAPALRRAGLAVEDAGDLAGPARPEPVTTTDGYHNLQQVLAWNRQVFGAVRTALHEGRLPLLMGGDHSLAIGSIAAVAHNCLAKGKKLRVLWLDAHADFNTKVTSPSGNLHGMPLACLFGMGPEALAPMTQLPNGQPALQASQLRQLGVRSVDPGEQLRLQAQKLEVFDMHGLRAAGLQAIMECALSGLDQHTHLHVSLDMDYLDPSVAPGVGTPVPDGLSYPEARWCMEMIRNGARLGSLDVVEINPTLDVHDQTARVAVDLVQNLLGRQ